MQISITERNRSTARRGLRPGAVGGLLLALACCVAPAAQASIMGHYFDFPVTPYQHPDIESNAINTNRLPGLVNSTLSGAFPTLTALGSSKIKDFNWWGQVPGLAPVTWKFDRMDNDLDFSAYGVKWFPTVPNMINPYKAFAAYWSGCLQVDADGSYTIPVTSDDDLWIFIDNQLVLDNGGLHATTLTSNTINLSLGAHKFDAFYAQRHTSEATLALKLPNGMHLEAECPTAPPVSGVPEPGSLMLLGSGLAALPLLRRRLVLAVRNKQA